MDPVTLAAAAGSALVGAMATDAWATVRDAMVAVWRRSHSHQVSVVEEDMNQLRRQALAAREQDDVPEREALVAEWQRRLAELIEDNPELTDHLDLVLREVLSPSLRRAEPGDVYQQVNVSRESPTFAVQRGDLHYYEGKSAGERSREGNSPRESRDPRSAG